MTPAEIAEVLTMLRTRLAISERADWVWLDITPREGKALLARIEELEQHRGGHLPTCGGMDTDRGECGCGYLQGTAYREMRMRIEELEQERDEARQFGETAAKLYNDSLVLRCAFCGYAYPDGTPATKHERLTAHVMVCQEHPLRSRISGLERERDDAQTIAATFDGILDKSGRALEVCVYGEEREDALPDVVSDAIEHIESLRSRLARCEGALREISEGLPCARPCDMAQPARCEACGHEPFQVWCAGCISRAALAALDEKGEQS